MGTIAFFTDAELGSLRSMVESFMGDVAEVHTVTGGNTLNPDLSVGSATTAQTYSGKCRVRVADDNVSSAEGEQVFTSVDVSFPHTVTAETDDLVNVTTVGDPYLSGWYVITRVHAQGQHVVRRVTCRKLSDNRLRQQ